MDGFVGGPIVLLELRNFIRHYRSVSTEQLTREFKIAHEALLPMLDIWVRKGKIQPLRSAQQCNGCQSCYSKQSQVVYYEWIHH